MDRPRSYTIDELRLLHLEAYHRTPDGHLYLWKDGVCVRVSPDRRVTVKVAHGMPEGPWLPRASVA